MTDASYHISPTLGAGKYIHPAQPSRIAPSRTFLHTDPQSLGNARLRPTSNNHPIRIISRQLTHHNGFQARVMASCLFALQIDVQFTDSAPRRGAASGNKLRMTLGLPVYAQSSNSCYDILPLTNIPIPTTSHVSRNEMFHIQLFHK